MQNEHIIHIIGSHNDIKEVLHTKGDLRKLMYKHSLDPGHLRKELELSYLEINDYWVSFIVKSAEDLSLDLQDLSMHIKDATITYQTFVIDKKQINYVEFLNGRILLQHNTTAH
jgi:hypothetical protein